MEWDLTIHLIPIVAAVLLSSTLLYVIRRADSQGAVYLSWMMVGSIGWSLKYAVQLTTRYRELILFLDQFFVIFVPLTVIPWFLFALEHAGYGDWQRRRVLTIVIAPAFVTCALLFTNDYHMLFWSEMSVKYDADTGLVLPNATPGIWFWGHIVHMYVLEIVTVILLVREALSNWSIYRLQAIVMIVATLPVAVVNLLYVMNMTIIDYTSTALALTAVGFAWGLHRHELFDLVPVARNTVLEEMRDAVIVMDNKGRIVDVNDAVTDILEHDGRIIGESASDVLPFNLVETDGGLPKSSRELTFSQGEVDRHYKLQTTRMTSGDGAYVGAILVLQNITELQQKNEELEILNRIVRHDIQNDMTIVNGYAEMLETELEGETREKLDPILRNTQHAIELTETVRNLMTAVTGEEDLEMESVDLVKLLEEEIERARAAHDQVTFDLVAPETGERIEVRGTTMLSSVITNLRSNAVRHNDTDEPEITVSVEVAEETVTIRVADNGPGVPEDKRDEIFGRGEKGLDSPGSGIGLYLVDTLVEEFGGSVHVEDNEPRGAVFVVELQRVSESEPSTAV